MPPVRHNTATFTHNNLECTTDSAELNTIASDLWRLCYEHVTNALATNSTKLWYEVCSHDLLSSSVRFELALLHVSAFVLQK
jgi:hypothetical protein